MVMKGFLLFVLLIGLSSSQIFPCNVENCASCTSLNFCGLCQTGYMLDINITSGYTMCTQVQCNIFQCAVCLTDGICESCKPGFHLNANRHCSIINNSTSPCENCHYCNENNECVQCPNGFTSINGECQPMVGGSIPGCQIYFNPGMCMYCYSGLAVSISYGCTGDQNQTCNVNNCTYCQSQNQCQKCQTGFTLFQSKCVKNTCNISNCQTCFGKTCQHCMAGYFFFENLCLPLALGCDVENCQYCAIEPQYCVVCNEGFRLFLEPHSSKQKCINISTIHVMPSLAGVNCMTLKDLEYENQLFEIGPQIACVECNTGFKNVGGYCVANLTTNIPCDVPNCTECSAPNFCGQCAEGFVSLKHSAGVCVKAISLIPGCLLSNEHNPATQCEFCLDGFIRSEGQCFPENKTITCDVEGCMYCLLNNVCAKCDSRGYTQTTTLGIATCTPQCNIDNCQVCGGQFICFMCEDGYQLTGFDTGCSPVSCPENTNCQPGKLNSDCECLECLSGFDGPTCCPIILKNMDGCIAYESPCSLTCIFCAPGYIEDGGKCLSLPCEINNCQFCFRSQQCIVCEESYTLINGTCQSYQIKQNCPKNCINCDSPTQCVQCAHGLQIYEGMCVCPFQNCLDCMGDSFCTLCAYPFTAALTRGGGCVPHPHVPLTCTITNCAFCFDINQCSYCSFGYSLQDNTCVKNSCPDQSNCLLCDGQESICFACQAGFSPDVIFGQNCVAIAENYECNLIGCSICETPETCSVCQELYQLTESQTCEPITCPQNCFYCLSSLECAICSPHYYKAVNGSCLVFNSSVAVTCQVENCLFCHEESTCMDCALGYQPSGGECIPQTCSAQNCAVCFMGGLHGESYCILCEQGYFLNTYLQCVAYTFATPQNIPTCNGIYNCLYCANDNKCSLCAKGWTVAHNLPNELYFQQQFVDINVTDYSVCVTPLFCGNNCSSCTNPEHCLECASQTMLVLTPSGNNYCTTGPCNSVIGCAICVNGTSSISCLECYSPYLLTMNSSLCGCPGAQSPYLKGLNSSQLAAINEKCVCNIQYCSLCTNPMQNSEPICQKCLPAFSLNISGNQSSCTCENQLFVNATSGDSFCVLCNIDYCTQCSEDNFCFQCMDSFININGTCQCYEEFIVVTPEEEGQLPVCQCPGDFIPIGDGTTCGCPDTYNSAANSTCICPNKTAEVNSTCLPCGVDFCANCSGPGVCTICLDSFEIVPIAAVGGNPAGAVCGCPNGTTLVSQLNTCVTCTLNNCLKCFQPNLCLTCSGLYLPNANSTECICRKGMIVSNTSGVCVCPSNQYYSPTASGTQLTVSQCVACNISNCLECSGAGVCTQCSIGFNLAPTEGQSAVSCQCPPTYIQVNNTCVCPNDFTLFNQVCYNCSIQNCDLCSDTNICMTCASNLIPIESQSECGCPQFMQYNNQTVSCECIENYTMFQGVCYECNLSYCSLCKSDGVCSTCEGNLQLISNNCSCFSTFSQNGSFCSCPVGTYENNNQTECIQCSTSIPNCVQCTNSATCSLCNTTFIKAEVLNANFQTIIGCKCPSTYEVINGSCQCPSGFIAFQETCILCNIQYCKSCSEENFCAQCAPSFVLVESGLNDTEYLCQCPDDSMFILNNTCVCPAGFILSNSTCIECPDPFCALCVTQDTCTKCLPTFILVTNVVDSQVSTTCQCPTSQTYNSTSNMCECEAGTFFNSGTQQCLPCTIESCVECSSEFACTVCENPWTLTAGKGSAMVCSCLLPFYQPENTILCECPPGSTASNGTCQVDYCESYNSEDVCESCISNFVLTVLHTCACPASYIESGESCVCPVGTILNPSDNTCYACNITQCTLCASNNTCVQCSNGYQALNGGCSCPTTNYIEVNNNCFECPLNNCTSCSANNVCTSCRSTFSLSGGVCACPNGTSFFINSTIVDGSAVETPMCVACAIPGCIECDGHNTCSQCGTNMTLLKQFNTCINCMVANCETCSLNNYCSVCSGTLSPSEDGSQCISCNVPSCLLCSSSNVCVACSSGNQLVSTNSATTECVSCTGIAGCLSCSSNNICSQCLAGYSLINNACILCSYPCATCDSNGSCATCQSPYLATPNNGTCYTCEIPGCTQCDANNTAVCTACVEGLSVKSGFCLPSCGSILCITCPSLGSCSACIDGFAPQAGLCVQCPNTPQCSVCDQATPTICKTCSAGYYLPSGSTACTACPTGCKTCQTSTSNSSEVTCLTLTNPNQILTQIGSKTVVAVCDPGCASCDPAMLSICLICSSGYTLDTTSKACLPCPEECMECTLSSSSTPGNASFNCLACYSNGFLSNGQCQTCTEASNCLTCHSTAPSVCTSCPNGYHLSGNSCVVGCPLNCAICSSSTVCTACVSGFSTNSAGFCVPCLSSCRSCSNGAPGECLDCGEGLFVNSNNKCQACSTKYCSKCSQSNVCQTCMAGYSLTPKFTCALTCQSPCATCSSTSPTQCFTCLAGYTFSLSTSTCEPTLSCSGGCSVCPNGYVLTAQQTCQQCTNNQCARCDSTNLGLCTSCMSGMYLSASMTCQACPSGCATCTSSKNCLTCQSGYTIPTQSVAGAQNKCIICASPCLTCSANPSNCVTCVSGYTLQGWKCVSNFNYQVVLTLGVDPAQFYLNYQAFLQLLANTISKNANLNLVSVGSITQGSTIVNAQLITDATSGSSLANDQFTSLTNLAAQGQTIAGMKVESSTLSVNGGTADDITVGSSVNLGLILGICIPVGVILVLIIVFCCYKRMNSREITEKEIYPPPENTGRGVRESFSLEMR